MSLGDGSGSGGVGGGGVEGDVEAVDRLAATASTLREAVGFLRSGVGSGAGAAGGAEGAAHARLLDEGETEAVDEARRRALSAVEELAGLLTSEVRLARVFVPILLPSFRPSFLHVSPPLLSFVYLLLFFSSSPFLLYFFVSILLIMFGVE